jgi:hypothetical protein
MVPGSGMGLEDQEGEAFHPRGVPEQLCLEERSHHHMSVLHRKAGHDRYRHHVLLMFIEERLQIRQALRLLPSCLIFLSRALPSKTLGEGLSRTPS